MDPTEKKSLIKKGKPSEGTALRKGALHQAKPHREGIPGDR